MHWIAALLMPELLALVHFSGRTQMKTRVVSLSLVGSNPYGLIAARVNSPIGRCVGSIVTSDAQGTDTHASDPGYSRALTLRTDVVRNVSWIERFIIARWLHEILARSEFREHERMERRAIDASPR